MNQNKSGDMTPFDRMRKPVRQNPLLLPLVWGGAWVCTRGGGLKIRKDLRGVKPPYLVLSTHQGFSDYYIAPLALFPRRANYVSDMEGFAAFGDWVYRNIGCIGKRRYVADISVVEHIRCCLKRGGSVVVFPESRHSNVGTTSKLPDNMGRFAKMMNVPVVALTVHGSYLANPFWDEEHARKVPLEARLECLYTLEELEESTAEQVQETLEKALQYDEYAWQREQRIPIRHPAGAEGLHKPLYQCRDCGAMGRMHTRENTLFCGNCGSSWELTEFGELRKNRGAGDSRQEMSQQDAETIHIPDWYEWERAEAIRWWDESEKSVSFPVRIEALPSEKGFVPLGEGVLKLTEEEFVLEGDQLKKALVFPHRSRESVQTEYNYRGKGECIVLSTLDCCYYLYPLKEGFFATWLQFVGEELHLRSKR